MKRLVICCDGTWNRMSAAEPTNVLMAAQCVLLSDASGVRQVTYYDEGVGTTYIVSRRIETMLAGAFGFGLLDKIEAAYRFIIFNYEPGDEIYIFGFSRGAYTARSLAGLIRKCGIIPRTMAGKIGEVIQFYKDKNTLPDSDDAQQFRMDYSPLVVIKEEDRAWRIDRQADPEIVNRLPLLNVAYLGVWDTVGALGVPQHLLVSKLFGTKDKYAFHDQNLSSTVASARHAIAIDENRLSFAPSTWENLDILNGGKGSKVPYREMWFPGGHGSVGGGGDVRGLSNRAFLWVMEGAQVQGLALDEARLAEAAAKIDHFAPLHNSTQKEGWMERVYRRGARSGPQQRSLLSDSAVARLNRLEKKGGDDDWKAYRPETLRALWPESGSDD